MAPETSESEALYEAVIKDRTCLRARLSELLDRPEVREALFIASPSLMNGIEAWHRDPAGRKGRRAEESLVRYVVRMCSRPTPFGLFSGCTTGKLTEKTRLRLGPRKDYRRHTRLDMGYLFALTEDLGRRKDFRRHLRFYPNTSLYIVADRLRYAKARTEGTQRSYQLMALERTDYLEKTLERARGRATIAELAQALVDDDPEGEISLEEAQEFIHELLDEQLLVSELTPIVTDPEPIRELLDQCGRYPVMTPIAEILREVLSSLAELDAFGPGGDPQKYWTISQGIEELSTPFKISQLFQVDMVKSAPVTLGSTVVRELERGIALLHRLAGPRIEDDLARFREAFKRRYEDAMDVPLVEVLDEENGIGFASSLEVGAEASPLLRDFEFSPEKRENKVSWGAVNDLLLEKLAKAWKCNASEIDIQERDLENLPQEEIPPLPNAFHVLARLAAKSEEAVREGQFQLYLKGAAGPSGARLLARFCHADDTLRGYVEQHLRAEEELQNDAIFAEIIHLPEGRLGNIISRPRMRRYEIPFLGRGSASLRDQIPITDLRVSVLGDRIILRSERLGRQIVPRLTSAHAFWGRNQGLYRFLCTLQVDGSCGSLSWNWGPLDKFSYLPRVTSGRLILSRGRWKVESSEISELVKGRHAERFRNAQKWRKRCRLPRWLTMIEGDQELLLDLDNILAIDILVAAARRRPSITLLEPFPEPDSLCVRGPEGRFFHELIVPFLRKRAEAPDAVRKPPTVRSTENRTGDLRPSRETVQRCFPPGTQWLYAKLYTGTSTADHVLRELVAPLVRDVMASGAADSWFFVRYGDPEWHLRLRFRGDPKRLGSEVLTRLNEVAATSVDTGLIWRLQIDTYKREIERYGGPAGIAIAEQIAWIDSEAVLAIVERLEGNEGAEARWRLALRGSALLLSQMLPYESSQLEALQNMRDSFGQRFQVDAHFRQQLARRLRKERANLETLLEPVWSQEHPLASGFAILDRRSRQLAPWFEKLHCLEDAGELTVPTMLLVRSFIHMFNNRLIRSEAGAHELIIYDFLYRLLVSRKMRSQ